MILLTETVLFYWNLFDPQSASSANDDCSSSIVKAWVETSKKPHSRATALHATSAPHPQITLLSKATSVQKSSTKSSYSSATQPPPTPRSASSIPAPVLYLDKDTELGGFYDSTQEKYGKGTTGVCSCTIAVIDLCGDQIK